MNITIDHLAEKITANLICDLSGRAGIGDEWDGIDSEIKDEIIARWEKIIERLLKSAGVE